MVLLTTLSILCVTNTNANGSNGQKSDVPPHFNFLDLRNAMMPILIPEALRDDNKSASVQLHFDYLN